MRVVVQFDGGGKNPGPSACAAVVSRPDGYVLKRASKLLGEATNNIAEYEGLLLGLQLAKAAGATFVEARGDSKLVVQQVNGRWECRASHLRTLRACAWRALGTFPAWSLTWVVREYNTAADMLVREALHPPPRPASG